MLLDKLQQNKTQIEALARRYGALRLRVFGSVAHRKEKPDSDMDFPRGYDLFAQRLPLAEELAHLLQRRVELIPEHELNPHIREMIISEAVEI